MWIYHHRRRHRRHCHRHLHQLHHYDESIFQAEGIGALYSGLAPTLLRTAPATGVMFLVLENSRMAMKYIVEKS